MSMIVMKVVVAVDGGDRNADEGAEMLMMVTEMRLMVMEMLLMKGQRC